MKKLLFTIFFIMLVPALLYAGTADTVRTDPTGTDQVPVYRSSLGGTTGAANPAAYFRVTLADLFDNLLSDDLKAIAALECSEGQVPLYGSSGWACGDPSGITGETLADIVDGLTSGTIELTSNVFFSDGAGNPYRSTVGQLLNLITIDMIPDLSGIYITSAAATAAFAAMGHNHDSRYQPLDSDLTQIAALSCTEGQIPIRNGSNQWVCGNTLTNASLAALVGALSYGTLARNSVVYTVIGGYSYKTTVADILDLLIAGDIPDLSSTYLTVTTAASTYSPIGHNHTGTYQSLDSDLTAIAALSCTENQIIKRNSSNQWVCATQDNPLTSANLASLVSALDSGALAKTSTVYVVIGSSSYKTTVADILGLLQAGDIPDLSSTYLAVATAASTYSPIGHNHTGTYQPLATALTQIAALNCTENQIIKRNSSNQWVCAADAGLTTESDPVVGAVNGVVKSNGAASFSVATADDIGDGTTNAIPTLIQEGNWDTAYGWGNHASAGYIGATGVTYENLSANGDVGTGSSQVSQGNHNHSGVYIGATGVTYENLSANGDVGTGSSQVATGNHTHTAGDIGALPDSTILPQTNSCSGTYKFSAYNATTGIFTCSEDEGGGGTGTDVNAIHVNALGEINSLTAKTTAVDADDLIIEDSAASWTKKKLALTDFWTYYIRTKGDARYVQPSAINFTNLNNNGSVGTGASQVAQGSHTHTGVYIGSAGVTYENLLANGDIGTGSSQVSQGNHTHGQYIGATGVTYENLYANGDIGSDSSQVSAGNHNHNAVYEPIINDDFDPDRIAGDASDDNLIDGAVMGECNNSKGALPTTAGAEVGTVPTVQEGGTVAWIQPSQISITTTLGEEFDSEAELRALTPIMQTSSLEDAETLTPTTGYKIVQVALTCEDTSTTFSISETGAVDGELLMIRNASTGAYDGDNCLLAYSAGVVEHEGGAGTSLTIKDNSVDNVILQYQEDRWVVISNFSSTRYFGYINIPDPTIDDPDNWTLDGYGRWIANAAGLASLPTATSGMNMVASVRGAYVAVIDPDGTEEIFLNGTTCGAGVSIQSEGDDDGERVSLSYSASGDWDATAYGWICTP